MNRHIAIRHNIVLIEARVTHLPIERMPKMGDILTLCLHQ